MIILRVILYVYYKVVDNDFDFILIPYCSCLYIVINIQYVCTISYMHDPTRILVFETISRCLTDDKETDTCWVYNIV